MAPTTPVQPRRAHCVLDCRNAIIVVTNSTKTCLASTDARTVKTTKITTSATTRTTHETRPRSTVSHRQSKRGTQCFHHWSGRHRKVLGHRRDHPASSQVSVAQGMCHDWGGGAQPARQTQCHVWRGHKYLDDISMGGDRHRTEGWSII